MPTRSLLVIPKLTVLSVLDIIAVAVLIYNLILLLRGRRALNVFGGLWVLLAVYFAAVWLRLELLRSVLATVAPYTAIALIVIFQGDIRRVLARLGRSRFLGLGGQLERRGQAARDPQNGLQVVARQTAGCGHGVHGGAM